MAWSVTNGDYIYKAETFELDGVELPLFETASAKVRNTTKSSYGAISSTITINGYSFRVTDLTSCFENCTSLTTAPTIPSGVEYMSNCFENCTSLTTAPTIPSGVTKMKECFKGCTALTGNVVINAKPTIFTSAFNGTARGIWLTGSSTKLNDLAATASSNNVFVGQIPLSYAMDVKRVSSDGLITETDGNFALVHVALSWSVFAQNSIESIVIKDENVTKNVTWYTDTNKTDSVSLPWHPGSNVDIYCWVEIDDRRQSFGITITDSYHSGQTIMFIVPPVFKTINFLPGGKGVAFGKRATQEGLDVEMDAIFRNELKKNNGTRDIDLNISEATIALYDALAGGTSWRE